MNPLLEALKLLNLLPKSSSLFDTSWANEPTVKEAVALVGIALNFFIEVENLGLDILMGQQLLFVSQ